MDTAHLQRSLLWASLVILLLQSPVSAQAQADSSRAAAPSPARAMAYSFFIPGGGQFYNGKYLKGLIIASAELGCVANAVIQNQYLKDEKNPYNREIYRDRRNLSYWWLAGIILYSMADAYVDAHLFNFDEDESISFDLQTRPSDRSMAANLNFHF